MERKIYINYDWYFKQKYQKEDLKANNFVGFSKVELPHSNKEVPLNNFDERTTHLVSIYKKIINIEELDSVYQLVFEGVGHYCRLYINQKLVSHHRCGYTRFATNITKYLRIGDNEIALIVDSREMYQPPFGFVIDYLCFGGVYREAYLLKLNKTNIKDYYFHHDHQKWYLDYQLSTKKKYRLDVNVLDKNQKIIFNKTAYNGDALFGKMKKVKLWDVDNPNLYSLVFKVIDENNNIIDEIRDLIGFRYVRFEKDGFYLNDEKLKILGVNRHQSYPYVGYAMPSRAQYEDALTIKKLGFNAVRTSHYPQSIEFLKACDELGLLVFEEIPGWQFVGDEKWQNIAINNVKEMIMRDKNHPCIMLWGVRVNESQDYHNFYSKTNELAHSLDPYRQTGGVRYLMKSECLEDVYTYNDFVNSGKNIYLRDKKQTTSDYDKPYLITEYGGHMFPTKSFDNENRRSKLTMLHANVVKEARLREEVCGTFAWCFADYNTHKDFGSGDLICYHGVCDIFRNPKYTSYVYLKYAKKPFLEVTSNFNIGESNGGYLRNFIISTNCDEVKMYHNNQLVQTFYIDDYKVNGTFEVDDLLGDLLINNHNVSKDKSNYLKKIVKELLEHDGIFVDELINKYDINDINEAWGYYGKYVANWGSKASAYRFEGYQKNKMVCKVFKGPQYKKYYKVTTSTDALNTKVSYDTCKITIEAIGNLNNRVDYAFDSFNIITNDSLKVIGDNNISLIGGVISFYVKSVVNEGEGIITISSYNNEKLQIKLKICNEENNGKHCLGSTYFIDVSN